MLADLHDPQQLICKVGDELWRQGRRKLNFLKLSRETFSRSKFSICESDHHLKRHMKSYSPLGRRVTLEPKTNLVRDTGCEKGDILIGPYPSNRDMKIRVSCAQDKGDNLQIKGGFDLLEAGTGKYRNSDERISGPWFRERTGTRQVSK